MGGGEDPTDAFAWQIRNANGGDYVVLRCSGSDGYQKWVWDLAVSIGRPLNSMTTILFTNQSAAYNATVLQVRCVLMPDVSHTPHTVHRTYVCGAVFCCLWHQLINNAEAIFFAGGDQSLYIGWWTGSPVQTALNNKVASVTIGGTSAGLAILGHFVYSSLFGSYV